MTQPGGPPNEFEKAAQQGRERVAAEKKRQEDEAAKKAAEAAAKAKLELEQEAARKRQFIDLAARFHAELVLPQLEAFARAQNVKFSRPTIDPPKEGTAPQYQSQVEIFPARHPS